MAWRLRLLSRAHGARCIARPGIVALAITASATAQTSFDNAKARYDVCRRRLAFYYHTEGREKVARVGSPQALTVLAADYAKPHDYPEYARYTLAALMGRHFNRTACVDQLDALRAAHAKPQHAWLWVNTLAVHLRRRDAQAAVRTAVESKSVALRAAAVLALTRVGERSLLDVIPALCGSLPKKEGEGRMLIAAMSAAIERMRDWRRSERFLQAVRAYIGLLSETNGLSRSNQLLVVRHLGQLLDSNAVWINPEPWIELLQRPRKRRDVENETVARQRFFGIESDGERVCYVVDLSDSMCKKIDERIKPKAAITGIRKKKRMRNVLPDETDIPWFKVETRFDLAREHLKISLQRLSKDKRFSVIWFGTENGTLACTKGMIPATRRNVARAIRELDSIRPGPPNENAPDGTLRGRTNLHGALRRAFSLKAKGAVPEHAYVDPKVIAQGCDTIFVLTDGAPSWDDFAVLDQDYGEGRVVKDTEYGVDAPRTEQIYYWGPYGRTDWIVEDVKRMNAFRRAQIHCVGIGEANMGLLEQIARSTMGQVYQFGRLRRTKQRR